MIVNWVKEDEELLEPYEWSNGDDIEIISTLSCFKVDQKTLHDFIYGCLHIFDQKLCQKVFAIGDGHYALAIETDDQSISTSLWRASAMPWPAASGASTVPARARVPSTRCCSSKRRTT